MGEFVPCLSRLLVAAGFPDLWPHYPNTLFLLSYLLSHFCGQICLCPTYRNTCDYTGVGKIRFAIVCEAQSLFLCYCLTIIVFIIIIINLPLPTLYVGPTQIIQDNLSILKTCI